MVHEDERILRINEVLSSLISQVNIETLDWRTHLGEQEFSGWLPPAFAKRLG